MFEVSMRAQIVRSETPFNAEPPLNRLRSNFVTPLSDFYVRCHGDVPFLSETTHTLAVQGRVAEPLKLSISELRSRFTPRNVMALMQRAGNRRADLHRLRRRSWNGGQTRPVVGLSGRRRSICRLGITNSPFVPGIRLDRRNPPWPRTPGTSKATSPPLGTEYA
jgi:DMSO/TMAO reductase YedYZ molybdopterin-dependent catalytic subunit